MKDIIHTQDRYCSWFQGFLACKILYLFTAEHCYSDNNKQFG